MCRHLAYLGEPVRPGALLVDPPHGLVRQSWAPREQQFGTVNADGFGIGWYADGCAEPARHRGAGPVWADETFADLARVVSTRALLAAVRSATPGMAPGAAAAAPFRSGRWLFSHNGRVDGWPEAVGPLAARLSPQRLLGLDAGTDSALLWALVQDLLHRGRPPGDALAELVAAVRSVTTGRLNLVLTDGRQIAATACGDTLYWYRPGDEPPWHTGVTGGRPPSPPGVVVASEPYDDAPGWQRVPDDHLLLADPGEVVTAPL